MNELGMQQLIVNHVNKQYGGFARKMSHRFNIGVADLLIKLPGYEAGVLEVKQRDLPQSKYHQWKLDVTVAQDRYLRSANAAGMPAGVASFTHQRRSGPLINRLRLVILTYQEFKDSGGIVIPSDHLPLNLNNGWNIREHLQVWLEKFKS